MHRTGIEYADFAWNPTTGCSPVSEGCRHCWAERMAKRLRGRVGYDAERPFYPAYRNERINEPMALKRPSVIATSFMGDLFHGDLAHTDAAKDVASTMAFAHWHQFLVLSKRLYHPGEAPAFTDNVWVGMTVETQEHLLPRFGRMERLLGGHPWLSLEPLLGPIDLEADLGHGREYRILDVVEWVVVGCESGPGRRPMHMYDAIRLRDQCREAGVPFMLKQADVFGQVVSLPGIGDDPCDDNPARDALEKEASND